MNFVTLSHLLIIHVCICVLHVQAACCMANTMSMESPCLLSLLTTVRAGKWVLVALDLFCYFVCMTTYLLSVRVCGLEL